MADRKYRIEPRAAGASKCATCGVTLHQPGETALWCATRDCPTTAAREPNDDLKKCLHRPKCATPRQAREWTADQ